MKRILLTLASSFTVLFASAQSISLNPNLSAEKLIEVGTARQGAFFCDGHLVCLSNDGVADAFPLDPVLPYPGAPEKYTFKIASSVYKPHCNVASCIKDGDNNWLYTSEWNNGRRFFVEDIHYIPAALSVNEDHPIVSEPEWRTRLVQILSVEADSTVFGAGYLDWAVDWEGERLYTVAYKEGMAKNDRQGSTTMVICELPLKKPAVKGGVEEILYKTTDVIRRAEYPVWFVTQDKEVHDGKLYILAGFKNKPDHNWDSSRIIGVINLASMQVEDVISLAGYDCEPEGLVFEGDNLYVTWYKDALYRLSGLF